MSILRRTTLIDGTMISTVLRDDPLVNLMDTLLDPVFDRKPGKYETMVFTSGYAREELCVRYDSEQEALEGHVAEVERWSQKRGARVLSHEDKDTEIVTIAPEGQA